MSDESKVYAHNYCISKEYDETEPEDFEYTTIISYENEKDKTIVELIGKGIAPTLKLSKTVFQFGECPINERRDMPFTLENKNPNLPAEVVFHKVSEEKNVKNNVQVVALLCEARHIQNTCEGASAADRYICPEEPRKV